VSIPGHAPHGFRAKKRPTKDSETKALNALQVLFDTTGVEEYGTYTDPVTHQETPVTRKILILLGLKHGEQGEFPTVRQIITEQAKAALQLGIDPSLNRLREDAESEILARKPAEIVNE